MKHNSMLPGSLTNTRYTWYSDHLEVQYFLPIHHIIGEVADGQILSCDEPHVSITMAHYGGNKYFLVATIEQKFSPGELNPLRAYNNTKEACYGVRERLLDKYESTIKNLLFEEIFR